LFDLQWQEALFKDVPGEYRVQAMLLRTGSKTGAKAKKKKLTLILFVFLSRLSSFNVRL